MLKEAQTALTLAQQQAEETANAARREAAAVNDCAQRDAEALIEGAEHEAENIIAAAQSEAESILLEVERNKQSIYDEANEKGYSEGVAASRSAILKMREDYENRLKDFFEQARSYNDIRNMEMEQNVLTLSIDVAESILDITLDRNFEPFFDLVKSAITQLNAKTRFIMRLNKREYDRFMEKDEMTRTALSDVPFSVICDGSLAPGALLLQADEGTVDAGIKTQLRSVKKVFGLTDEDT
jgi:flagellar assembly protein FliH